MDDVKVIMLTIDYVIYGLLLLLFFFKERTGNVSGCVFVFENVLCISA